MGAQRTFIGALACIVLSRGHDAATAFPSGSFQDQVALIQHSLTGGDLSSRSADRRPESGAGSHVSLLALGASASTKWYDNDGEDASLLRKLADRKKVVEEREEEERLQAEAAKVSGAAFLTEQAGKTLLDMEKRIGKQWLTKADLDHLAEDEVELNELAVKLQRIAAEVARIAKHQLDFGKHLGLPDPNVDTFRVNDKVEIMISKGKHAGKWVKAVITGHGSRTGTYKVHIPSAKAGTQDMNMVPAVSMRRDEDAIPDSISGPRAVKYEVGEQAQIQVLLSGFNSWVKCSITSLGTQPDTYNIFIPSVPAGHRDMTNVAAKFLRKIEANMLFSQYDLDGDGELSNQEFDLAVKERATNVKAGSPSNPDGKALFAAGESAEIWSGEIGGNGTYLSCTVLSEGELADSYNVFVPSANVGFQYLANQEVERLRKVGENRDAFEQKVSLIPSFVDHEVIAPRGTYKGRWVPCQLKRKGRGNSFDVWMPFGVTRGHNNAPNIPAGKIRVRQTCGPGYDDIFNGDCPGSDQFGRINNKKDTVEACAVDCNKRAECLSFEWNPTSKACNLNRLSNPTLPQSSYQLFCRRKDVPRAQLQWDGPLIGQPVEYTTSSGEHSGEWHTGIVKSFGETPNTYSINASVSVPGVAEKFEVLPNVSISLLRYAKDKPLVAVTGNWTPPTGDDAIWVNKTKVHQESRKQEGKSQAFLVIKGELKDAGKGLLFRASKHLNDTLSAHAFAAWDQYVNGVDEGDGWVRVGDAFLPTFVNNTPVLKPRITGEPGELVQVKYKDDIWLAATIRSLGDNPNTYNLKLTNGKTFENIHANFIRKAISAPRVATPAAAKSRPKAAATKAPMAEVGTTPAPETQATTSTTSTTSTVTTTTGLSKEQLRDQAFEAYKERKRQEYKREQMEKKEAATVASTEPEVKDFLLDNRLLRHKGPGMAFRSSKRLDDSQGRSAMAYWGSYVSGVNEGDGWIRVDEDKYLPTTINGTEVISQKVVGTGGEIVQVEGEDGSWVHGSVRSRGDWPETFNIHIQDNAAGYDLDNVPVRRVRHELEQPAQPREKAVEPVPVAASPQAAEEVPGAELLPETGDLGKDLPDGVFRANMTAEVKINAGPQAGSWVRCSVLSEGELENTYNLYVPAAPQEYQNMQNIPALAMRKIGAHLTSTNTAVANVTKIDASGIDGEPGESVEMYVKRGVNAGKWLPSVIIGPGAKPDTYDIRLPGYYGSHKDFPNVPGAQLRKAFMKVEISVEEDYPIFEPGEEAEVTVEQGDGSSKVHPCVVRAKGDFTNTYNLDVEGEGPLEGVHVKFMKKVEAKTTTTTTTTTAPRPLTMATLMSFIDFVRPDVTEVVTVLANSKTELKRQQKRAKVWRAGCTTRDRHAFLVQLRTMGKAPAPDILASVPEQCKIASWDNDGDVMWDAVAECFRKSANVSQHCAYCPTQFMINVAEGCLSRCQPMVLACGHGEETSSICASKASQCLDCMQEPATKLMRCVGMPGQESFSQAMSRIVKNSKAGDLNFEETLSTKLSPILYQRLNLLSNLGLRTMRHAWKVITGRL